MERNKIIGLVVFALLFVGFSYFNTTENEKYLAKKAEYEAQIEAIQAEKRVEQSKIESKSAEEIKAESVAQIGQTLTAARTAAASDIVLENEELRVVLSTRGAQVKDVTLKEYTKYPEENKKERTELVKLFEPATAEMNLSFFVRNGFGEFKIESNDYTFTELSRRTLSDSEEVTLGLSFDSGARLEYIYTLYKTADEARNYMLDFKVRMQGLSAIMSNQQSMSLYWSNTSYQNERGFSNENTYTTVAYRLAGEKSSEELGVSTESKSENIAQGIDWVAFKQQYFSSVIIAPEGGISKGDVSYKTAEDGSGYIKTFKATMELPLLPNKSEYDMALYFGPNSYPTLKAVNDLGYGDLRIEELVPLGWGIFGWVNKFLVIPVFELLKEHIASFGVIILILAILVKIIILPMTYSSYLSMAKMRLIKPEVDALNARFPKQEDAAAKQQATMELYNKAGVNPLGGCIPMLIQMPVIIARFRFFPASIELRGESFLWANDLSSYDSILTLPFNIPFYGDHVSLFALLMTIVLVVYSLQNYNQSASAQPQMAGMKFMMVYMMPLMMLFWFNSYSSGLCYYYFLTNVLTIIQTIAIRRMIDDDKIHAMLRANTEKNKNKQKSKFQQRYEEALAEQQRKQGK